MINKFIESTLDYLNVKSLEENPFMLDKTVIDSSKYISLENYMIHLEDIRDGKDIPANLIETFKDPESERESTPKLQVGDDDLGMLLELPAYLYDDEVNSFDYIFYPLDSNLKGFTKDDITNLSYSNIYPQKIDIDRSIPHENFCSEITRFSNDPLFNHEGLQTAATYTDEKQTRNLLTLEVSDNDQTSQSDDENFHYRFTCSGGYLSNIAKLKKIIISDDNSKSVLYNQNYALSEECFVAIASSTGEEPVTIISPPFNVSEGSSYSISFYAKLVGGNEATFTTQLYNSTSEQYKYSVNNPTASYTYTDSSGNGPSATLSITSSWKRFMTTFKAVATASYELRFSIPSAYAKYDSSTENLVYIMLCGILVEQSECPSPYDGRKHSLDVNKVKLSEHIKAYTSIIGLDAVLAENDNFSLAKDNWLITYKRLINSPTKTTSHIDSLGTHIKWGFKYNSNENSSVLIGNTIDPNKTTLKYVEGKLETVIVYKLGTEVYNIGYVDGKELYRVTLPVDNIENFTDTDYSLCYRDNNNISNNSHATGFNLQLGGEGYYNRDNGTDYFPPTRYSGSYKELLFIKHITDETVENLINSIVNAQFGINLHGNKTLLVTNDLMEKL